MSFTAEVLNDAGDFAISSVTRQQIRCDKNVASRNSAIDEVATVVNDIRDFVRLLFGRHEFVVAFGAVAK